MRYIWIVLVLGLFITESRAGKNEGEEESLERPATVSMRTPKGIPEGEDASPAGDASKPIAALSPQEQQFTEFYVSLQEAARDNKAYTLRSLYDKFQRLPVGEGVWEAIARAQKIQKWPSQSSWREVVGGQWFLNAAFNEPHQHLLRNAMRAELLPWASGEESDLEDRYPKAGNAISTLMERHAYLRRRAALFALAGATCFQNPVAAFFLEGGLWYHFEDQRFIGNFTTQTPAAFSLEGGREALRCFIDVPGIEAYVDLKGKAALKDLEQLRVKARLGLVHYNVLAGDIMKQRATLPYRTEQRDPIITEYRLAAALGDGEGALKAGGTMSAVLSHHMESKHPLKLRKQYDYDAAFYGYTRAYRFTHIKRRLDEEGIPGTGEGMFREVQKFLTKRFPAGKVK